MEYLEAERALRVMTDSLRHRGPDDGGLWLDAVSGVALGHRRLAVLDLSPAGHQPMFSPSGRYVIAFNGEIYNHLDLRAALDQVMWRGTSDTETLLAAIDAWGLPEALRRCSGMFAIALWDRERRVLALARDRLGEKPLYCGWQGERFLFGSELKAIERYPGFGGEIDRVAVRGYLSRGYFAAPHTVYSCVEKVKPGCILWIDPSVPRVRARSLESYWSLRDVVARGNWASGMTDEQAIDELHIHLQAAIDRQMVADVEIGAFLSGGIDSSLVVALMQAKSTRPVRTFTIGYHEQAYDEAGHAARVARHLGTNHTELYVTDEDAASVVPFLQTMYDEPFGDSSAIPTHLVAGLARRDVVVSLSGDGGDELFGGYSRYLRTAHCRAVFGRLPQSARQWLARLAAIVPPVVDRYPSLPAALASRGVVDLYLSLLEQWPPTGTGGNIAHTPENSGPHISAPSDVEQMMLEDSLTYLPDDVLCKVDRAAMAVSLETRVPLLDHNIVEFAWSLPLSMKVREGRGKWLLRQLLARYVPTELTERPKMGFAVPVDSWIRGSLRDWAEDLLSESSLGRHNLFNVAQVRRRWTQHLAGTRNWRDPLWIVLQLQAWLRLRTP